MKLTEIKKIVEGITFDDTAIEEINFYNKEFQRHHIGSLLNVPQEQHKPIYHLLINSFNLQDLIEQDKRDKETIFNISHQKLIIFLSDFIRFLEENNIEDKTMPVVPK